MGKKEKIPPPGNKKDEFTNFYNKGKWKQLMQKAVLDCTGRNLRPTGAQIVGNALSRNKWVTHLDLSHNHLGDQGATELAQFLKMNDTMQIVNISCNEISDVGGIAIASAFIPSANPSGQPSQWNRSICYLNMAGNKMRDDTLQAICAAASCHRDLVKVELQYNEIGPLGCKGMARCMQRNPTCAFALHCNRLGDEGTELICAAWRRFGGKGQQSVLNMTNNDVCKDGASVIGDLLVNNDFVEEVNLSWNTVGAKGTQLLVSKLLMNSSKSFVLRVLNLSNNCIEDDGAVEIAKLIDAGFETLTKLNLAGNKIKDRGGEAVAKAIARSPVIQFVSLADNELGDRTVAALMEAVVSCKPLRVLDLRNAQLTEHHKMKMTDVAHHRPQPTKEEKEKDKDKGNLRMDMGREAVPMVQYIKMIEEEMASAPEEEEKTKKKKKKK